MTTTQVPAGHALFARYAYPPNELGYCGPTDPAVLLRDEDVVRSYWVGSDLLLRVDPDGLLRRLRIAFGGQVTGLLPDLTDQRGVLAHHSFHVFAVYPWVRFLDRDPVIPLRVMQNCSIRWGTVESIAGEHV